MKIEVIEDRPATGMWHCGPNAVWVTATHRPTMASVRVYSGNKHQHHARQSALAALEMIVDDAGGRECAFPDRVETPLAQCATTPPASATTPSQPLDDEG